MGDQAFYEFRLSEYERIKEDNKMIDECWVSDPASFGEVLLKCAALDPNPINFQFYDDLGYFALVPRSQVENWLQTEKEISEFSQMTQAIAEYEQYYSDYLKEDVLSKVSFDLVIYDEIEKFRDYDHPDFNYPFQARKTIVNSFTLDNSMIEYVDGIYSLLNYEYSRQEVKFQGSEVCLESHWFKVITDFFPEVT